MQFVLELLNISNILINILHAVLVLHVNVSDAKSLNINVQNWVNLVKVVSICVISLV